MNFCIFFIFLCIAAPTFCAPLFSSWHFSPFRRYSRDLKPLDQARFAPSLQGFSNIFKPPSHSGAWEPRNQFPALSRTSWGSYPFGDAREQPLAPVRGARQSGAGGFGESYPTSSNKSRPPRRRNPSLASSAPSYGAANLNRRATGYNNNGGYYPRQAPGYLYRGVHMVPRSQLNEAELHGMVCVSATALDELIRAAHQDRTDITTTPDGKVTTHRTILAGKHGNTEHSTRVATGAASTKVETVTNSSTAVQKHRQLTEETATGLVQTSAGSVFDKGEQGTPSFTDVVTRSQTPGGNSISRASASGYSLEERVPTRSSSETSSGGKKELPDQQLEETLPEEEEVIPQTQEEAEEVDTDDKEEATVEKTSGE